ncbi:MAG: outer membrane beta-barrel protein [Emcibacter sp.]|nr:outer membrane beta-barrel protein [Emcibacter sp.]
MSYRFKTAFISAAALTFATLSATTLTTSQAQAGVDGNPFEGLYLGLHANYSRVTSKNTYVDLEPDADANNFITGIGDGTKGTGYGGTLYGGIGTNFWGPVYVSIEGALGLPGGKAAAIVNTVIPEHIVNDETIPAEFGTRDLTIKTGFAFDINTRLGFTVSDNILIYGLGGYTSTKFKMSDAGGDFSKGAGGYRYGAGFEIGIMEDIALRIEYVRTAHSKINWRRGADDLFFDPSTEVLRIGVILHMD